MPISQLRVDLVSDTATRPTAKMREAIMQAEVGDEQRGEDPTTNQLCARVAKLLGKEAAVYLPSGVMCNQIAILVHCRPGDEVLADESAHVISSEAGGSAALAGAMIRPLPGNEGIFGLDDITSAIRPYKRNAPRARLIVVEQTVNRGGGTIWPLQNLVDIGELSQSLGLAVHMDGARLMNAVVASGVSAAEFATPCDSVWVDFSKGLGCPVGAVLAGSAEFIEQAWVWKHRLGGAMRQSGMMAAAGIYALDHHIDRLSEDHANAQRFAELIADIPGIRLTSGHVQTNLVFFDVQGAGMTGADIAEKLRASGYRIGVESAYRMRAVTHLDVSRADVEEAAAALRALLHMEA